MSRISLTETLSQIKAEDRRALVTYVTAGDPGLDETLCFMMAMTAGKADIIELGVPFSDPIADGKVIQEAAVRSLTRGTTPKDVLELVARYRNTASEVQQVPVLLLMYYNNTLAYGPGRFVDDAAAAGVDGFVIPDLPPEESGDMESYCRSKGLALIRFIAPTGTAERISAVTKDAEAFLYCVSVTGVTGVRQGISNDLGIQMARYREFTNLPLLVGFGIASPQDARDAAAQSDGVIIGTAIVKLIADSLSDGLPVDTVAVRLTDFIHEIRNAIDTRSNESDKKS